MTNESYVKLCTSAWGDNSQYLIATEEICELNRQLTSFLMGENTNPEHIDILEEIADFYVVYRSLEYLVNKDNELERHKTSLKQNWENLELDKKEATLMAIKFLTRLQHSIFRFIRRKEDPKVFEKMVNAELAIKYYTRDFSAEAMKKIEKIFNEKIDRTIERAIKEL